VFDAGDGAALVEKNDVTVELGVVTDLGTIEIPE
jgi:hypothetical protein